MAGEDDSFAEAVDIPADPIAPSQRITGTESCATESIGFAVNESTTPDPGRAAARSCAAACAASRSSCCRRCWRRRCCPVLLVGAAIYDVVRLVRGGPRWVACRLVAFGWVFLLTDAVGILALGVIWVASGGGRGRGEQGMIRWTYAVQRAWTGVMLNSLRRLFRLRFEVEGDDVIEPGPLIVLIRHASIVDNLLPANFVTAPHDLPLRYVLKRELAGRAVPRHRRLPAAERVRRARWGGERRGAGADPAARGRSGTRRGHADLPRGNSLHARATRARDRPPTRVGARGSRAPVGAHRASPATPYRRVLTLLDALPRRRTSSSARTSASTACAASARSSPAGLSGRLFACASRASPAPTSPTITQHAWHGSTTLG